MMKTPVFPAFRFDGNLWFGVVDSRSKLLALLLSEYGGKALQAKESSSSDPPCFGFYLEHCGDRTLEEFLAQHGVQVPKRPVKVSAPSGGI